jgi:hypothetical protein
MTTSPTAIPSASLFMRLLCFAAHPTLPYSYAFERADRDDFEEVVVCLRKTRGRRSGASYAKELSRSERPSSRCISGSNGGKKFGREDGVYMSRRAERTWAPSRCRMGRRLRKKSERVIVDVYLIKGILCGRVMGGNADIRYEQGKKLWKPRWDEPIARCDIVDADYRSTQM